MAVGSQPPTGALWVEVDHSSQWAEFTAVWLVITQELGLTLCTDSWALLKGLTGLAMIMRAPSPIVPGTGTVYWNLQWDLP